MKLMQKWINRISSPVMTETDIIHFKSKVLGRLARTSLTDGDKEELKDLFASCKVKSITQEHSQKGIDYLNRKLFNKKGQARSDAFTLAAGEEFVAAVKDFDSFLFVGFAIVASNVWHNQYMPVYRVITKSGKFFDYTMTIKLMVDVIDSGELKDAPQTMGFYEAPNCIYR